MLKFVSFETQNSACLTEGITADFATVPSVTPAVGKRPDIPVIQNHKEFVQSVYLITQSQTIEIEHSLVLQDYHL